VNISKAASSLMIENQISCTTSPACSDVAAVLLSPAPLVPTAQQHCNFH
jgi:hypothetical protein